MKRILRTLILIGLCLSTTVTAVAATPGSSYVKDESASSQFPGDFGQLNQPGGGFGHNGGGALINIGSGVSPGDDFHNAVSSGQYPGGQNGMGSGTAPPADNLFNLDPTENDIGQKIDRLKDMFENDPDSFFNELADAVGQSAVDDIKAKAAAGECPTLTVEPTVNMTGKGSVTTQGWFDHVTGGAEFVYTDSLKDNLNNAIRNDPSIAELFNGDPRLNTSYNYLTSMFGVQYNRREGVFEEYTDMNYGTYQAKPDDADSARHGAIYFNLCEALDVPPEPEEEPPPPEVTEVGPLQEWKSKPLAFGEVKNNNYSISRTSEEWEAMAGIPHDESLFYDAGGSTFSAHFKTKNKEDFTTSKPTVPNPKTTCISKPCANGYCKAGPHCDEHPTCYDHYCSGGYYDSDGERHGCDEHDSPEVHPRTCCSHGLCRRGSRQHSITVKFQMPAEIKTYYPMEGIDVRWMDAFTESLSWANPSSISIDADKLTASVTWNSNYGPGSDGFQDIATIYDCRVAYGCRPFAEAVMKNLQRWKDEKFAWFATQSLTVRDRDGNSHDVLWDNDLEFYTVSWNNLTQCGTTTVVVKMKGSQVGERAVSQGEIITYPSDSIHEDRLPKKETNFLPYEDNWSTTNKIDICGYNGQYSNPRRHYHGNPGDKHFFTQSGITIADIVNGEKTSGPGTLDFGPQGGGRHNNFFWGSGVNAEDSARTEYYQGAGSVNNIVVHSPVALSQLYHQVRAMPHEQLIPSQTGAAGAVYITPSLDFDIVSSIEWKPNGVEVSKKGIANTTAQKGNGYYYGRDTERWIDKKYYSFPFEVLYKGVRYGANDWIPIPASESRSTFTLPVSEKEVSMAVYKGVVIAKNEPNKDPDHVFNSDSEYIQNYERGSSPHGSSGKEAMHGANNRNQVSILGRIGNFAVEYSDDPNWGPFFSKTTSGWQIPNVLQNVDIRQPNKFLGPHRDIFDRRHWTVVGSTYRSTFPWGLDHYGGVPTLGKDLMGAILPAGEGKNNESYNSLLQYKPIKLGYTAWWSIQTIGNYGTAATKLKAQPQFYLFDPLTPETKQYVDVWTKVGAMYRRIYDHTGKTDSPTYTLDYFTKLNQPERRIGDVEKNRTALVASASSLGDLFSERVNVNFGSPNGMTLQQNLRTFIGGTMWENVDHQPNAVGRSEADHAEQVQRWHGTIYLPASSKFTKPGEKDFLTTQVLDGSGKPVRNLLIGVEFTFTTEGASPWNITTGDKLIVGSNYDGYTPWIEIIPPETPEHPQDPSNPPLIEVPTPPNVPIVFDPNENSLQDISLHGTH